MGATDLSIGLPSRLGPAEFLGGREDRRRMKALRTALAKTAIFSPPYRSAYASIMQDACGERNPKNGSRELRNTP